MIGKTRFTGTNYPLIAIGNTYSDSFVATLYSIKILIN